MTTERVDTNRGAALILELKELVDSFPDHQRKEVISLVRHVFQALTPSLEFAPEDGNGFGREESA